MSDPTQPQDVNKNSPTDASADAAGAPEQADTGTAAQTEQAPKPQAYVDPSIAAEAQHVALEAEVADWKDKCFRAHAEMENLRKRTEREKADTAKYAISKFAGDMLAIADNLQRALVAVGDAEEGADAKTKALVEGVQLIDSELGKALERHGVRKIEALGTIFDPNFHQAVMEEENKEVAAGTVLKVFQEGYQISERVLRPSMVVVARGGAKPVKDESAAPDAGIAANDDAPTSDETSEPPNQAESP